MWRSTEARRESGARCLVQVNASHPASPFRSSHVPGTCTITALTKLGRSTLRTMARCSFCDRLHILLQTQPVKRQLTVDCGSSGVVVWCAAVLLQHHYYGDDMGEARGQGVGLLYFKGCSQAPDIVSSHLSSSEKRGEGERKREVNGMFID